MQSRESGPGESFWFRMGETYSNNSVFTYHFEGQFDQEKMRIAVKKLVDSQEYLRVFYRTESDKITLFIKDDLPFPYEFKKIANEEEYLALSEHYRNTPFNEKTGRLWLLLHLEYVDEGGVVQTKLMCIQNHAIADGEASKILYEQLLSVYQDESLELPHVAFREHYESFLPKTGFFDRLKSIFTFLKFVYTKSTKEFMGHPIRQLEGQTPRTKSFAFRLSESESSNLLANIKQRKAKAHGIFCAACLKAFYKLYEVEGEKHVAFSNPVNYRSRLLGDFTRDIAYFIIPVNAQVAMRPDISIWELAETVNEQIAFKSKTPYLAFTSNMLGGLMKKFTSYEQLNDYLTHASNNFAVISNVGKFPVPDIDMDGIKLKDISLIPSTQAFQKASLAFTIVLINGCLRFEMVFSEPFMEYATVEKAGALIKENLLSI